MKKRWFAGVLALCILFGCFGMAVSASSLFEKNRVYSTSVFTDIAQSEWFYTEISNCYEMGLVSGDGSGKFYPYDLISRAEVISIAARVHSAYVKDKRSFVATESEAWYMPYVAYAIESKIITAADFDADYTVPASRREVAYIYANSLPYTEFRNINITIDRLPDVDDTDDYYNQIIMLYRAGVVAGKDETGKFSPKEYISRAEATAILNRVADASQRISTTLPNVDTTTQPEADKYNAVEIAAKCSPAIFYIEICNRNGTVIASGSGFFISQDGLAVTNYHVIEDAYSAKVRLIDGTEHTVSGLRGYDKNNDLAIIQIDGDGFPYLTLGDSDALQNGQTIFCVGSPLGLENTISEGIVSNAKRVFDDITYIQISAPISSGSSGGAVLDDAGTVIGVSSAGFEDGQNLNLAMPINLVKEMQTDILITFAQFQSGSGSVSGENIPTVNVPTIVEGYYTDNVQIPDFGYVTGVAQIQYSPANADGVVTRCYVYNYNALEAYLRVLMQCGFSVAQHQYNTYGITVYMRKGETLVCISAQPSKNTIMLLYYIESANQSSIYTYPNTSIPDYAAVTGRRLRNKVAMSDQEGYIYCYTYIASEMQDYIAALEQQEFIYYNASPMDGGVIYFYDKGDELVGIYVNRFLNEIWIIA